MEDYLIRGMDKSGRLRVFAASTTHLVEHARSIHNTSPTATAALGRSLTAGAIMGSMMKNDSDILTLKISGGGPIGNIIIVADNKGNVKGLADNPFADVPSRSDGKLDVGRLVGKNGVVTTIMDLGLKDPYVGQSNLVSGEIGEDIANLYLVSEQQPSAVALGVLVDKDISCRAAGGYFIQLLPGIDDEDIDRIEERIKVSPSVSAMIDKGLTPEDIVKELLGDFDIDILSTMGLNYKCNCSRDKIRKVLISLGKKEVEDMLKEDGKAEVVCHFCNTKYQFNKEDLAKILVDI
ncbi:Hsp33 family molecular chaperone HslO [Paratissierella segnis]|jgi:molecular chaperone Hsp33|uniref:33 kDa chaperonin n=1 Tax=Paratissierella segnis TaxID=2763679 RepID=A0A926IGA3_9FIRM|nr:Hsp33 family molecular chaperone HslO [Paratissierella segnis]MBC8589377.1 Hsp33 family molecular chaperone HslO [Paratissierella segnis]